MRKGGVTGMEREEEGWGRRFGSSNIEGGMGMKREKDGAGGSVESSNIGGGGAGENRGREWRKRAVEWRG